MLSKRLISVITALCLSIGILCAVPLTADAEVVVYALSERSILGDADVDNYVSSIDVTCIQRNLVDIPTSSYCEALADADFDGIVTVLDATYIQRWLADMPSVEAIGDLYFGWVDKTEENKSSDNLLGDIIIQEIYPDYFFATPVFPFPYNIKINGRLSDMWCVGDHVVCTCKNVYYDINTGHVEADMITIGPSYAVVDPYVCYKPVIYLYPEEETEVSVDLELNGSFLYTEPEYNDGWNVTAAPDGTLTAADGSTYPYLYWEGKLDTEYDLSKGFCVKGSDTEAFLNDALNKLGLNERETEDFIEFWLKHMENNPYNVISFQTEAYTDAAQLTISPEPDVTIRVFMTWYASDEAVDIPAQELSAPARTGFTAVEWGGSMVTG